MMDYTQSSFWTENTYSRGTNYSEAALTYIFNTPSNFANRLKYKLAKIENNISREVPEENIYILLDKVDENLYTVYGPGANYRINGETKYSCKAINLVCGGSGTDKDCEKNSCVYGLLEYLEQDSIYKYTSVNQDIYGDNLVYYTVDALNSQLNSYSINIEAPILKGKTLKDIRDILILKAYENKCGLNEACINTNLSSGKKEDIIIATTKYSQTFGDAWEGYFNKQMESLYQIEFATPFDLVSEIAKVFYFARDRILLYKSKYQNFKINDNKSFARPVYYRLPACYKSDIEDDTIILRDIEQRFNLTNDDVKFGDIVLSQDLKSGYRFVPKVINNPLSRIENGLDPFDLTIKYSPKDKRSWEYLSEDSIPQFDISKWLTSGVDSILSYTHRRANRFFYDFLDPSTCFIAALDWIYQFFGWDPQQWDVNWDVDTKRGLLRNSLGWDDVNLYKTRISVESGEDIKTYTPKSLAMRDFPFDIMEDLWNELDPIEDSLSCHFLGDIILYKLVENHITGKYYEEDIDVEYNISKERWNGLYATKGTLINLIFLTLVYKIYGEDYANEIIDAPEDTPVSLDTSTNMIKRYALNIPVYNIRDKLKRVSLKNLSREYKPVRPIVLNSLQTGIKEDINYLSNMLIAGISRINYDESRYIFPLSYRYNRIGQKWTSLSNSFDYWKHILAKTRIQYSFPAADYVAVDDYFFDYEISMDRKTRVEFIKDGRKHAVVFSINLSRTDLSSNIGTVIPGFNIPKHNLIIITEDYEGKLVKVMYLLNETIMQTLDFSYDDHVFKTPYKVTEIQSTN